MIEEIRTLHLEAFSREPLYGPDEARSIADLAETLIQEGRPSFTLERDGVVVAHACYTPLTLIAAPRLKTFVMAPLAVLPAWQRQGLASELMNRAEEALEADAMFVLGNPLHYARRFSTPHQVSTPQPTEHGDCWFARALTPGVLKGVRSGSRIEGALNNPELW